MNTKSAFLSYVDTYAATNKERTASEKYLLRFWRENKSHFLVRLLGGELDLTRKVIYNRPSKELYGAMAGLLNDEYAFKSHLLRSLREKFSSLEEGEAAYPSSLFYRAIQDCFSTDRLVAGEIHIFDNKCVKLRLKTPDGAKFTLNEGEKVMRALGRLAKAFDLEKEFEHFRIAHSQILNQKRLSGTLHLSILPLDYATASDNENGWSSCMSWRDNGCYRLGTVEMMNSPYVICAYLASDSATLQMPNGEDWPSKKWRAWVIVNEDVILVNKNYPYENQDLCATVVEWVKELAAKNLGWRYGECSSDLDYDALGITFKTQYMYNDVGVTNSYGAMREDYNTDTDYFTFDFSGPATCMACGEVIKFNYGNREAQAASLTCEKCGAYAVCSCCGEIIYNEDDIYYYDDEIYCNCCFENNFSYCGYCDTYHPIDDMIVITFMRDYKKEPALNMYVSTQQNTYVCRGALSGLGIDEDKDIIDYSYPVKVTSAQGYAINIYYYHLLNPNNVSYEQAKALFRWKDNAERSNRISWENYQEILREQEFID